MVTAAGNVAGLSQTFPAAYAGVISVGASDSDGELSAFSARGGIKMAAIGVDVPVMRTDGTWGTASGTSVAAAMVTRYIAEQISAGFPVAKVLQMAQEKFKLVAE